MLQAKRAKAMTAHAWPVDAAAQFKANAKKARAALQRSKIRKAKIQHKTKLANDKLDDSQNQSVRSVKAAEDT